MKLTYNVQFNLNETFVNAAQWKRTAKKFQFIRNYRTKNHSYIRDV